MKKSPENRPGKAPDNVIERESELESAIDAQIEECVIEFSRKINSGNNGVIFRLDLRDAPENLINTLDKIGIDTKEQRVIKLLKMYNAGAGEREYKLQSQAYSAMTNAKDTAKIPKPYLYRHIKLSERARGHLNTQGINTVATHGVDVLIMDHVPGADLATILYKEALQRALPEVYPNIHDLDATDWTVVLQQLGPRIGFSVPGGKGKSESDILREIRKVETENVEILLQHLKKTGFVLHHAILDQVSASLQVMHKAGIAHRDMHERNVMISGNYTYKPNEKPPQAYIIDFGGAINFNGVYSAGREDIFSDGQKKFVNDENINVRYALLAENQAMKRKRGISEASSEVRELITKAKTPELNQISDKWVEYFKKTQASRSTSLEKMYNAILAGKSGDYKFLRFLAIADVLVSNGLIEIDQVKDLLTKSNPLVNQQNIIRAWSAPNSLENK